MVYEGAVRRTMQTQLAQFEGAYLADVRFTEDPKSAVVRALVRGPNPLTAEQVASLERELPIPPNKARSELRVRFVHASVMTANGPLYGHDEAALHAPSPH